MSVDSSSYGNQSWEVARGEWRRDRSSLFICCASGNGLFSFVRSKFARMHTLTHIHAHILIQAAQCVLFVVKNVSASLRLKRLERKSYTNGVCTRKRGTIEQKRSSRTYTISTRRRISLHASTQWWQVSFHSIPLRRPCAAARARLFSDSHYQNCCSYADAAIRVCRLRCARKHIIHIETRFLCCPHSFAHTAWLCLRT